MTDHSGNIRFQADHHPLVFSGRFSSLTDYCLHLMHLKAYEEAASLAAGKAILDLGCNNGYGSAVLGEVCSQVVALDVSPSAIEDARERFGNRDIDFRLYDGRNIPCDNQSFDVAVSFQVIEHLADTAPYLTEITRVLRPSGSALFTTPNAAIRLDRDMKPWNEFHVGEYRADELAGILKVVFDEVNIRGLFAIEELYQIELDRCQKALQTTRSRNPPRRRSLLEQSRDMLAHFTKIILPSSAIDYIRARRAVITPELDPVMIKKYSTGDLFYRSDNLDEALDLMAICSMKPTN
jgi:SAM-dependent methyltransferase